MTGWSVVDAFVRAHGLGARPRSLGQTVGGTHAGGSFHYIGQAVDYGRSDSDADAIAQLLKPYATGPNAPIVELFGSEGTSLKNGVVLSPEPAGHAGSHTHVAIRAGVTTLDGFTPAAGPVNASLTPAPGLESLGSAGMAIRLFEVGLGSLLILMGFVALSRSLKGTPWPTM